MLSTSRHLSGGDASESVIQDDLEYLSYWFNIQIDYWHI